MTGKRLVMIDLGDLIAQIDDLPEVGDYSEGVRLTSVVDLIEGLDAPADPGLSMLSDLMEEVHSLRARLDDIFPKAEP